MCVVVFECKVKDPKGQMVKLNSINFSANSKFKPGYCLGMSVDWAKTTIKFGSVKTLDMLHPWEWPIIQSAYEVSAKLKGGPDGITAIEASGLTVTNSDSGGYKGNELTFNQDFGSLAQQLATRVGTYIIYLGGGPGGGGHFMGFRRKGAGTFILGEWFDPNDCLMSVNKEADWMDYIKGMLNYCYSNSQTSHIDLRQYCCIAQVEMDIHSSIVSQQPQGGGSKDQFKVLKSMFSK